MRRIIPLLLVAAAACATTKTASTPVAEAPPPAPPAPPESVAQAPAPAAPACHADADCVASQLCVESRCVAIDASTAACTGISTHFDFDRAIVRTDDFPELQRAARCLRALPATRLRIEGNCDDRGT